jgi:DNA-binding winged helix-turn-helix (wHTH) protein/TolB-like protein
MRFADFDLDERTGVLRRAGARVKLQDLPFRMLVVLLKRAPNVVTREELRAELWGSETFVDAEAGLNTAVAKIREAIGDSAESPRFIETLPKRGYRFIGTLEPELTPRIPSATNPPVVATAPSTRRLRRWLTFAGLGLVAVAAVAWAWTRVTEQVTIAVVRFHNETGNPDHDRIAGTLTDAVVVSLAEDPRYGVIGNSPLLRTERIFADASKIGQALSADYVLLGQLQSGDAGLLVRAHLIRTSDQKHLWAAPIALAPTKTEAALTGAVREGVGKALGLRH